MNMSGFDPQVGQSRNIAGNLPSVRVAEQQQEFWTDPLAYRQVAGGIQHVEALRLLTRHKFGADDLIIDVGSGDGSFTVNHLLKCVPDGQVVGLDKSVAMIEAAGNYSKQQAPDRKITFIHGDIVESGGVWKSEVMDLLKASQSAVVVFTNSTLHHIYSWDQFRLALSNIHDLLTTVSGQSARFLASFAGHGNFDLLIECADSVRQGDEWQKYFADWNGYPLLRPTAERMREELDQIGFDAASGSVELVPLDILLKSENELFEFVRNCLKSYVNHLRESLLSQGTEGKQQQEIVEKFASAIKQLFMEKCEFKNDGRIVFPVVNIEISVAPKVAFRVADFTAGQEVASARELKLIEFLERVNQLPEVQAYKPLVKQLLQIEPGQTVLDAGCGTGVDSLWMQADLKGTGTLIALDSNPTRVAYTRDRLESAESVIRKVEQQNLNQINLEAGSVDRIYCERVLIHAENPQQILTEFYRVLKPGGRVVLVEPDFTGITYKTDLPDIAAKIVAARAGEIRNPAIGNQLENLAENLGFEVEAVQVRNLAHDYEASKMLDLNDIASASNKPAYPSESDVNLWLAEQAERAKTGRFETQTPMHIATLVKPG